MHRAYEYLQQCKDKPSVWYDVEVSRGPKSGAYPETHDWGFGSFVQREFL
jgi:hypothetical protein